MPSKSFRRLMRTVRDQHSSMQVKLNGLEYPWTNVSLDGVVQGAVNWVRRFSELSEERLDMDLRGWGEGAANVQSALDLNVVRRLRGVASPQDVEPFADILRSVGIVRDALRAYTNEDKGNETTSEHLFEELCRWVGISCFRVPEVQGARRPDYEIELAGRWVVTEIKQFNPNDEEAEATRSMEAGGVVTTGTKPGDRIRKAIRSAAPQLRELSEGRRPAMLVVYNNVTSCPLHADPYAVATAMLGLDEVPVSVPEDPSIKPQFQDVRSGPGKKMTPNANTTISAIGVLVRNQGVPNLRVYHNRHAANRIEPDWLRAEPVRHFRLANGTSSSLDCWQEI